MATMKTAIATMKVAQISQPGGEFEIVEREIPKPQTGKYASKSKPAESATATP